MPFADGLRNLPSLGFGPTLRLSVAGLRDQIGAALGRPPQMVPSVGPPGSVAVMTTPDAEPGLRAIDPPGSTWCNEAAARIALRVGGYRPGRHAYRIAAPVLFAIAEDDAITPSAFSRAAAARASHRLESAEFGEAQKRVPLRRGRPPPCSVRTLNRHTGTARLRNEQTRRSSGCCSPVPPASSDGTTERPALFSRM